LTIFDVAVNEELFLHQMVKCFTSCRITHYLNLLGEPQGSVKTHHESGFIGGPSFRRHGGRDLPLHEPDECPLQREYMLYFFAGGFALRVLGL
jgi:hypothetical protein